MIMTPITALHPFILPEAKGVAVPLMNQAIINSAVEFCKRTRMWRYQTSLVIDPTVQSQPIPALQDADVFEIESARYNNERNLERVSMACLDENFYNWRDTAYTSGCPQCISQEVQDEVVVVPVADGTINLSLFMQPAKTALTLPDYMCGKYRTIIARGALAELLLKKSQPYTDENTAAYYVSWVKAELDKLSGNQIRGQQRAPIRSKATFM